MLKSDLSRLCCLAGKVQPIAQVVFPLAAAPAALRQLAAAKHIGKVVVEVVSGKWQARDTTQRGTWIVTGGLGGLGSLSSQWLAGQGLWHLALLGRTGCVMHSCSADQLALVKPADERLPLLKTTCQEAGSNDILHIDIIPENIYSRN